MSTGAIGHNDELKLPGRIIDVQVGPGLAAGWLLNNQIRVKRPLLRLRKRKSTNEYQGEDERGLFHVLMFKAGYDSGLNIQKKIVL
jgi:hypothetical protein